jgi:hypothetical protein
LYCVLFKFRKGVKFEIDCRKTALLLLHYDMQNRITLRFGIIIQPTKGICLGGHCPPYKADSNIPSRCPPAPAISSRFCVRT